MTHKTLIDDTALKEIVQKMTEKLELEENAMTVFPDEVHGCNLVRYVSTNGTRSIPKLICVASESGEEIGTWGPRPGKIQEMVQVFKRMNPEADKIEFNKNLHRWYARDKGLTLQQEMIDMIVKWSGGHSKETSTDNLKSLDLSQN